MANAEQSKQKTAIVIGAGRGIGGACARELHACGYKLVLMSPNNAKALAEELGCIGLSGSSTSVSDLENGVSTAMKAFGRIDAVVNNTGNSKTTWNEVTKPFEPEFERSPMDVTDEDWFEGLEIYMLNVVRMARLVAPIMAKQGGGSIVNISSFASREPRLTYPVSGAIRAALSSFTKMFADRHGRENIRMNDLSPGVVENFTDNYGAAEGMLQSIPMRRAGSLEEMAKTAAFLLSDGAGYINGQNIIVDGAANRAH